MNSKIISCIFALIFCFACEEKSEKSKFQNSSFHTVVNFSTVDTSPVFKNCEKLLDDEKTECFRLTMQEKFVEVLSEKSFVTKESIEETITVILLITKDGKVKMKAIESSEIIQNQLPELSTIIEDIIATMPKLYPATKRGIPVATEYQLPINIQTSHSN